jgi:hypothetical protein
VAQPLTSSRVGERHPDSTRLAPPTTQRLRQIRLPVWQLPRTRTAPP